jgi:hypothetical protein
MQGNSTTEILFNLANRIEGSQDSKELSIQINDLEERLTLKLEGEAEARQKLSMKVFKSLKELEST